jgi:hypothetical protein
LKVTSLLKLGDEHLKQMALHYADTVEADWRTSEVNEPHAVVRMNFAIGRARGLIAAAEAEQDMLRKKAQYAIAVKMLGFARYHHHFQRRTTRRESEMIYAAGQ